MFNKKKDKKIKCDYCRSKILESYDFCPHCGEPTFEDYEDPRDQGLLGNSDLLSSGMFQGANLGVLDKALGALMNNLVKSLDKELTKDFQTQNPNNTEIKTFPNGIKIKIGGKNIAPQAAKKAENKLTNKEPTSSQLKKLSALPRAEAKSSLRRLPDKLIYELSTPGLNSKEDIFLSKVETGYEVKAIGSKKIYVNTLPITLPLHDLSLANNKLLVEFKTHE